jgi:hypothetical protein
MCFHVRAHVPGFRESLPTLETFVRFLSGVSTNVYLESA